MGEGWHNNHHACQSSVRQGFRWWEFDATYYILRVLAWLGVVWDLKMPPAKVLRNEQRLGARVIARAAAQLASHFNPVRIALAITSAVHGPELIALREKLLRTRQRAAGALKDLHLPPIPNRDQILAEAKSRFASSVSLEEIADRAYAIVLDSISAYLAGGSHLSVDNSRIRDGGLPTPRGREKDHWDVATIGRIEDGQQATL
jgi:stearoyl-CoA desaturase (delta-9 desaturase)